MTERERLVRLLGHGICATTRSIEKIADYLLANGVIAPPCKVGDTVWSFDILPEHKPLLECEVIEIGKDRLHPYIIVEPKGLRGIRRGYPFYQIGKLVFLSKEEAEQALQKS